MKKKHSRFSRRHLERFINELCSLAKDLCPEAEIEVRIPGYEESDAKIRVVVPDDTWDVVDEALSQRAYEIDVEEGYDIGVSVIERSHIERMVGKAGDEQPIATV
ncbi:MAG: hypothetical protein HY709_04055 [Candidatus Latescibacteria bacterium]|nr:hypothetical protein [Candidatus Latescibacterota bacterium]